MFGHIILFYCLLGGFDVEFYQWEAVVFMSLNLFKVFNKVSDCGRGCACLYLVRETCQPTKGHVAPQCNHLTCRSA